MEPRFGAVPDRSIQSPRSRNDERQDVLFVLELERADLAEIVTIDLIGKWPKAFDAN